VSVPVPSGIKDVERSAAEEEFRASPAILEAQLTNDKKTHRRKEQS